MQCSGDTDAKLTFVMLPMPPLRGEIGKPNNCQCLPHPRLTNTPSRMLLQQPNHGGQTVDGAAAAHQRTAMLPLRPGTRREAAAPVRQCKPVRNHAHGEFPQPPACFNPFRKDGTTFLGASIFVKRVHCDGSTSVVINLSIQMTRMAHLLYCQCIETPPTVLTCPGKNSPPCSLWPPP